MQYWGLLIRPDIHGFLPDSKRNISRKFLIYITTSSICFCGRYCLFHPNFFVACPPSRNRLSNVICGSWLPSPEERQLAPSQQGGGGTKCFYWEVNVRATCNFHIASFKTMCNTYLPLSLFPILQDEIWNWSCVHFDYAEKQRGPPGVWSNRVKGVWIPRWPLGVHLEQRLIP